MHPVQVLLDDQHYKKALERASEAGFKTVEEYVVDVLTHDLDEETENFDELFTPERIAHIDKVLGEVKAGGKTYTPKEVDAHLAERRAEWIRKNGK